MSYSINQIKEKIQALYNRGQNYRYLIEGSITDIDEKDIAIIKGYCFYKASKIINVNLPAVTNMGAAAFQDCASVQKVNLPKLTFINGGVFINCTALKSVAFGKLTAVSTWNFSNCPEVENISVGAGTYSSLYFQNCPKLTTECLQNLVDNLADMTGKTAPVFQIGETNLAKLSAEYITKLNQKNWSYK